MSGDNHETAGSPARPVRFIHIGDLHLTNLPLNTHPTRLARQRTLRADLGGILDEIASLKVGMPDFVYLPGDIAEDGEADQYFLLERMLETTLFKDGRFPLHLIPGDHDRQFGTMDDFAAFRSFVQRHVRKIRDPVTNTITRYREGKDAPSVQIEQYYYARNVRGLRCIFLDVISAGYGRKGFGLDFRLGAAQLEWLNDQVANARKDDRPCAVFMHCYPHDLADRDEQAAVSGLLWNERALLVEMGHTHYNELAPDGRTLYATARSVGQNEDGPVGYAVAAVDLAHRDSPVTSWRFKQSQLGLPFVLITSPADRRLATAPLHRSKVGTIVVRAIVMSNTDVGDDGCTCCVDGGAWRTMERMADDVFQLSVPWHEGSKHVAVKVSVQVDADTVLTDMDAIEPVDVDFLPPATPARPGSDDQAMAKWTVKGVRGDQAGPNRSGYRW